MKEDVQSIRKDKLVTSNFPKIDSDESSSDFSRQKGEDSNDSVQIILSDIPNHDNNDITNQDNYNFKDEYDEKCNLINNLNNQITQGKPNTHESQNGYSNSTKNTTENKIQAKKQIENPDSKKSINGEKLSCDEENQKTPDFLQRKRKKNPPTKKGNMSGNKDKLLNLNKNQDKIENDCTQGKQIINTEGKKNSKNIFVIIKKRMRYLDNDIIRTKVSRYATKSLVNFTNQILEDSKVPKIHRLGTPTDYFIKYLFPKLNDEDEQKLEDEEDEPILEDKPKLGDEAIIKDEPKLEDEEDEPILVDEQKIKDETKLGDELNEPKFGDEPKLKEESKIKVEPNLKDKQKLSPDKYIAELKRMKYSEMTIRNFLILFSQKDEDSKQKKKDNKKIIEKFGINEQNYDLSRFKKILDTKFSEYMDIYNGIIDRELFKGCPKVEDDIEKIKLKNNRKKDDNYKNKFKDISKDLNAFKTNYKKQK